MDNKSFTEVMNVVTKHENTNIVQPFQEVVNCLVEGDNIFKNGHEIGPVVKSWTNHLNVYYRCLLTSFDLGMPFNEHC